MFSINIKDITYRKQDKSNTIIEFPEILEISKQLKKYYKQLKELQCKYYSLLLESIYSKYSSCLKKINDIVADIDVSYCGWQIAITNNYCCPQIVKKNNSFLDVKDIRHPLVEKINDSVEYVTNDNQLFTRILHNDNIFRSQSSFAVEIEELRSLLIRSCENSLILGDELCSGTETNSALSIVSTGLYSLCKKNSKFIFTSHLHQLTEINMVKELKNLQICHLKIKFEGDQLIYDRKLNLGSGPPVYGLKVCEALGMPLEFVNTAYKIQKSLLKQNPKQSNYNQDVILDVCEICKQPAEETDHIKEQCLSDERGIIDNFHKNHFENKTLKKKYDQNQINTILTYKQEYHKNIKNTIKLLDLQNNIQISKKTLQQIMEGIY